MVQARKATILDHFAELDEPRVERRERCVITDQDCPDYLVPRDNGPTESRRRGGGLPRHRRRRRQPAPLLHQQPGGLSRATAGRRQKPPEHRKLIAPNPGRVLLGRPERSTQGVRKDHGPQNVNTLRQIGHNLWLGADEDGTSSFTARIRSRNSSGELAPGKWAGFIHRDSRQAVAVMERTGPPATPAP